MGLPLNMSNLHAPTVPSGPTTAPITNGTATHLTIPELQRRKANLEAELKALGSVLDSHGVDMNTSLLTRDGFPRADIDIAQIRTTRARIIYLRNDYKELMAIVEKQLHEHFASLPEDQEPSSAAADGGGIDPSRAPETPANNPVVDASPEALLRLEEPFAKVNSVVENSPAASAGLQPGDAIRSFGYVNASNHEALSKLAQCVQANLGQNILVKVSRHSADNLQAQELQLTLTPRQNWGGRGMLGCHILPL